MKRTGISRLLVFVAALIAGVSLICAFGELELRLQMILLPDREQAEAILKQIKSGESFEKLAKERSVDATAVDGGHLGKVKISGLRDELKEALKGLGPGDVSRVIHAPSGFMILKVLPEPEQDVAYVAGFEEMLYFVSRLPKSPDYHQDLKAICELKREAVRRAIKELETEIAGTRDPRRLLGAHHTLAQLRAYEGDMPQAIEQFQAAYDLARLQGDKELELAFLEKAGIAWMRKGEIDNCLHSHHARSCIFPLTPEARHKLVAGSEKASALFVKYLETNPVDLEVKWLLNIAAMTLGKHPDGVPAAHLILPAAFASKEDPGRFVDIAPQLGLDRMNTAGGAVMDDLDGDGFLDIAISIVDACECMRYYHNNGDGSFSDWTARAGLTDQLGGINLNQADFNNDGRLDLFVMRGGWEFPMRNSLLRQNADGTFSDVTRAAGLAVPAYATPTAAWADYDNDGLVDLFVGNENGPGQLFRNKGDGTFADVARAAGVDRVAYTKGAVWGDYDNDGSPDLYVSNYGQENFLYHNNGDGTFTEVARRLGVEKPIQSFPVWFFDYNNDGWLDLFVASYVHSVADIAGEYLKLPPRGETMKLYRNTGKGGFEDVTHEVGLDRVTMAMGANFGDFDNDGFLDFYLGTGAPSYGALVPNLLFRNHGGEYFVDVTAASGTGHLQKGHGIAFGDINNDGTPEIFLHTGGAIPGDTYNNVMFARAGNGNHWIGIYLVGRKTNRAAIGARIKVSLGGRSIHREVSSGGSFGASSFLQQIGLGKAARIETLEIWWPASKTRQVFHDVAADQFIEISEFEKKWRKLERRSFALPHSR